MLNLSKSRSGFTKCLDRVLERIGCLRECYSMVNKHYDITVVKDEKGLALSVIWERNSTCEMQDSKICHYVLRTSHTDWDLEIQHWSLTEL